MPLERKGQQEDCYFTYCYSPIRDEDQAVGGVLVTVFETTERVLSERRMRCLQELAEARADVTSVSEVLSRAGEILGRYASEVPFACLHRVDEAGTVVDSAYVGLAQPVAASAWPIQESIERREPIVVAALPAVVSDAGSSEHRPTSAIVLPVVGSSQSDGGAVLVCGLNPRRVFDSGYRSFLDLVGENLAAGLASASTREQERQRAEALAALDRAKTAFLTNVSHEFRTPLTLMLAPLEDVIAGARHDPELVARLESVSLNGKRLLRLVNSLLDFTRVEAGQSEPQLQTVDVGALTAQIASSFAEVCERAGIVLRLECDSVPGAIDMEMWETIVLNLVSNAFKFTVQGEITVSVARPDPEQIVVTVSDTGTGIAKEDLPRLSERFYRAPNVSGRSVEGSGIGLALVRSLVELQGGNLQIESQLGAGTAVTIRLPAHLSSVSATATDRPAGWRSYTDNPYVSEAFQWLRGEDDDQRAAGADRPADRPLVLVADDNADMRRYLDRALRPRWNVVAFGDGRSALEAARNLMPDLIVTDVMMPTLDGFALVEAIRSDPKLATLPVIMLSARAGVESAGDGFAAGSDDYLVKPFSSQDLINRIEARLQSVARGRLSAEQHALAAERSTALVELSARLSAVASVPDLLAELLASPVASRGASMAALATLEPDRAHVRAYFAGEIHSEFADRYHTLALDAPVPGVEVIRTNQPMVIRDTRNLEQRYAVVVSDATPAIRAALIEPLRRPDGEAVGGLTLAWPTPQQFSEEEIALAEQVAHMVTLTLQRIEVAEHEHNIAAALQERLLDLDVSSSAAVISALYQPAREVLRVGGDWYTATALDQGSRLAISVGDVVGNGLEGATVMSQLRSALGAAALARTDPSAVLELLERYATRVSGAACATVAYAVIDSDAGSVEYACAGHPYPLLLTADGTVSYLEEGRRVPLASSCPRPGGATGRSDLGPGSVLLLYTDGLIERRGESLDAGLNRLASAAADCALLPVSEVCSALLARMAPENGYTDDVALVAVRPAAATAQSFIQSVPAQKTEIAPLRGRLRAWLRSVGMSLQSEHDVLLAVGEAVNNAMEHGSDFDWRRSVSLEVFADGSRISATVGDRGHWKGDSAASRRASSRGHGLTVIHGLSKDVQTVRTLLGTRVTMTFESSQ